MLDLRLLETSALADVGTRRALVEHILTHRDPGRLTRADAHRLAVVADGDDHTWLLPLLTAHPAPWIRAVAAAHRRVTGGALHQLLSGDPAVPAFALPHATDPDRVTALVHAIDVTALPNAIDAVAEAADRLLELGDAPRTAWAAVLAKLGQLSVDDTGQRLARTTRLIAATAPAGTVTAALSTLPAPVPAHLLEVFLQPTQAPAGLVRTVTATLTEAGDGPDVAYVTSLLSSELSDSDRRLLRGHCATHPTDRASSLFGAGLAEGTAAPTAAAALTACSNASTLAAWADLPPLPADCELALAGNRNLPVAVVAARTATLTDPNVVDSILGLRADPALTARVYVGAPDLVTDARLDPAACAKLADLKAAGTLVPARRRTRPGGWGAALEDLTVTDLGTFTGRGAVEADCVSAHCAGLLAAHLGGGEGFLATVELLSNQPALTVADITAAAAAATLPTLSR